MDAQMFITSFGAYKLYSVKKWSEPATISFTGGCLRMDGVASALNASFPECHNCQFFNEKSGNAGLLGAAVLILKKLQLG